MRGFLLLSGLVACIRVPEFRGTSDGPTDDASDANDAPMDLGPIGPWTEPKLILNVNSAADDECPSVSSDGLELYFASSRLSRPVIFVARRPNKNAPWGTPEEVALLASPFILAKPVITANGMELLVSATTVAAGDYDIYRSTRVALGMPWEAPAKVNEISHGGQDFMGSFAAGDCKLYFGQHLSDYDIFHTSRSTGVFDGNTIDGINQLGAHDEHPWVSDDETLIIFTSNRENPMSDLFTATRAHSMAAWSTATPVENVNMSDARDYCAVLVDERTLYMTSNRGGTADLYVSTR